VCDVIDFEFTTDTYHLSTAHHPLTYSNRFTGAVPMSATWFKDDVPVPDCEDFAYTVGENGTFTLSIVDPFSADSGNYSCKVVNTFGEAVSHGQLVIKGSYQA
jgi:hypothetical protein